MNSCVLLCLSLLKCIIIFAILCTSCVHGVLELWGGFNDHSDQPDFHFIPLLTMCSGRVVCIHDYLLLWLVGKVVVLMSNLNDAACNDIISAPIEAETSPCCGYVLIYVV